MARGRYHANNVQKLTKTKLDGTIVWQKQGFFGQDEKLPYRPTWFATPPGPYVRRGAAPRRASRDDAPGARRDVHAGLPAGHGGVQRARRAEVLVIVS